MAKTLKGEAATIVNGLSAQLPSQFEHLIAAVMEHRSGCGGSTRVNTLAAAAAQFNQHCEMLRTAHRISTLAWMVLKKRGLAMYQAKTIPEAVRQFELAALPHISAIVTALGVPFENDKDWRESKNTAGHYYRNNSRDRVHFDHPVNLVSARRVRGEVVPSANARPSC